MATPPAPPQIVQWLQEAQQGSVEALGRVLDAFRPYLLQVANEELPDDVRAKVGGSDIVQQTFLEARQDFSHFQGQTAAELIAWLRRILQNNLINVTRQFRLTGKRQLDREVGGEAAGELPGNEPTPSKHALAREAQEAIEKALARLPEEFQQVIRLRNQQRLSFADIGQRMDRTVTAARKLWVRAVERLRAELRPR